MLLCNGYTYQVCRCKRLMALCNEIKLTIFTILYFPGNVNSRNSKVSIPACGKSKYLTQPRLFYTIYFAVSSWRSSMVVGI